MKAKIHPAYFPTATARCLCGASFAVGSTKEELSVEICSQCHPFYSGQDKIIDTAGRVERFKKRRGSALVKPAKKTKTPVGKSRSKTAHGFGELKIGS